jgi:hypothetical protein
MYLFQRLCRADEDEPRRSVFRKIRIGARLVNRTAQQPARTRQTSALVTDGRKPDLIARRRVPNELIPPA